uniref:Uncharacterized protein n=1 Tax=Glossina palpalis gambiensis TaxID=67801 RepID=A0A1B0AY51_9MUSC
MSFVKPTMEPSSGSPTVVPCKTSKLRSFNIFIPGRKDKVSPTTKFEKACKRPLKGKPMAPWTPAASPDKRADNEPTDNCKQVDLPQPDEPTKATVVPALTLIFKPRCTMTSGRAGYRKKTSLNSTSPRKP